MKIPNNLKKIIKFYIFLLFILTHLYLGYSLMSHDLNILNWQESHKLDFGIAFAMTTLAFILSSILLYDNYDEN